MIAGEIAGIVVFVAAVNLALLLLHPPPLHGSRAPWTLFLSNSGPLGGDEDCVDGAERAESKQCRREGRPQSYFAFDRMDPDDLVGLGWRVLWDEWISVSTKPCLTGLRNGHYLNVQAR